MTAKSRCSIYSNHIFLDFQFYWRCHIDYLHPIMQEVTETNTRLFPPISGRQNTNKPKQQQAHNPNGDFASIAPFTCIAVFALVATLRTQHVAIAAGREAPNIHIYVGYAMLDPLVHELDGGLPPPPPQHYGQFHIQFLSLMATILPSLYALHFTCISLCFFQVVSSLLDILLDIVTSSLQS